MIFWLAGAALAGIDPRCDDKQPVPYYEQVQVDFLQNHYSLVTTFSPIHGPVPHAAGNGAVGMDLALMPPLSCTRRFALNASKTEDTNRIPVLPRPRATFALRLAEGWVVTGGVAFVPPLPIGGQCTTLLSGEIGVGWAVARRFQTGLRVHATGMRTIADVATSIDRDHPAADDLYLSNSYGADWLGGIPLGAVTPYLAVGLTDVSSVFWVGDDGVMSNNLHPYFGPVASIGLDGLWRRFRSGAELYVAPGGHTRPIKSYPNEVGFGGYGHLYTVRVRVAYEVGPKAEP